MSRPVEASIDLSALRQNLNVVRRAAPNSRVWSVVKADAYGHGLKHVWGGLRDTDGFAMLNLEDAIRLREWGWKGPVLLLEGFFHADELELFDKYRLTTSVHSNWQIKAIQDAKLHAPLDIYLKVNSGMNRLGFTPDRVSTVWQILRKVPNVGAMTLMSHFADAEKARVSNARCSESNRRQKGWIVRARLPIQPQRSGTLKRIMTGYVRALFSMARHLPASGRMWQTAVSNR